jgi:hypothetical protein
MRLRIYVELGNIRIQVFIEPGYRFRKFQESEGDWDDELGA